MGKSSSDISNPDFPENPGQMIEELSNRQNDNFERASEIIRNQAREDTERIVNQVIASNQHLAEVSLDIRNLLEQLLGAPNAPPNGGHNVHLNLEPPPNNQPLNRELGFGPEIHNGRPGRMKISERLFEFAHRIQPGPRGFQLRNDPGLGRIGRGGFRAPRMQRARIQSPDDGEEDPEFGNDRPPPPAANLEEVRNLIRQEIGRGHNRLVYRKPYPDYIDRDYPYPRGVPELTLFSGDDNRSTVEHVGRFIAQCQDTASNDYWKLRQFPISLTGSAFQWYITLRPDSIHTWDQMEEAFHEQFYFVEPVLSIANLSRLRQLPDEKAEAFIARGRRIGAQSQFQRRNWLNLPCKAYLTTYVRSSVASTFGVSVSWPLRPLTMSTFFEKKLKESLRQSELIIRIQTMRPI